MQRELVLDGQVAEDAAEAQTGAAGEDLHVLQHERTLMKKQANKETKTKKYKRRNQPSFATA